MRVTLEERAGHRPFAFEAGRQATFPRPRPPGADVEEVMSDIGSKPYGYSFDRERFVGEFATREQAVDAGLRAAQARNVNVDAVFVGKRVPLDPQADHHADDVARSMRRRMQARTGDSGYLAGANEHVLADLDSAITKTICEWLKRHDLVPAARVASISEHAIPAVRAHAPDRSNEVQLIGPEE